MSEEALSPKKAHNSLIIDTDAYDDTIQNDLIQHAIELRKKKGLHSEFWYKLDELVDKIKLYKERTTVTSKVEDFKDDNNLKKPAASKEHGIAMLSSSKKIAFARR